MPLKSFLFILATILFAFSFGFAQADSQECTGKPDGTACTAATATAQDCKIGVCRSNICYPDSSKCSGQSTSTPTTPSSTGGSAQVSIAPIGTLDANGFLIGILGYLQKIVAYLALIFVVVGAVLYLLSATNENFVKAAKACWTSALIGLAIVGAGPAFVSAIRNIAFSGSATPTSIEAIPGIKQIAINTLGFLLSIVGILGIIGLVLGGIMYLFAIADKSQADNAKKAIQYSLIGIGLAAASLVLVTQVAEIVTK